MRTDTEAAKLEAWAMRIQKSQPVLAILIRQDLHFRAETNTPVEESDVKL